MEIQKESLPLDFVYSKYCSEHIFLQLLFHCLLFIQFLNFTKWDTSNKGKKLFHFCINCLFSMEYPKIPFRKQNIPFPTSQLWSITSALKDVKNSISTQTQLQPEPTLILPSPTRTHGSMFSQWLSHFTHRSRPYPPLLDDDQLKCRQSCFLPLRSPHF